MPRIFEIVHEEQIPGGARNHRGFIADGELLRCLERLYPGFVEVQVVRANGERTWISSAHPGTFEPYNQPPKVGVSCHGFDPCDCDELAALLCDEV